MDNSHSCLHMVLMCYTEVIPSKTPREFDRMGAYHSHCYTTLAGEFDYSQKS